MVLLVDEFEELQMRVEDNRISRTILSNIRHLMQHEKKLSFLFCGTHKLEAIRDVESKMFTGQNVLLKDVLNHFLDHELKRPIDEGKSEEEKKDEILKRKKDFKANADKLISGMKNRIYTKACPKNTLFLSGAQHP